MKEGYKTFDLVGNTKLKTAATVEHLAIMCGGQQRAATLGDIVKMYGRGGRCIVFADTKAEANDLALSSSIMSECQPLHGDISQSREK